MRSKSTFLHLLLASLCGLFCCTNAWSKIALSYDGDTSLLILNFKGENKLLLPLIPSEKIRDNLYKTGLINYHRGVAHDKAPDNSTIRKHLIKHILTGSVTRKRSGIYVVRVKLAKTVLAGKEAPLTLSVIANKNTLRYQVNRLSSLLLKAFTGANGMFHRRIAYVEKTVKGKRTTYSLIISDLEGKQRQTLVSAGDRILFKPQWSPDGAHIAYTTVVDNKGMVVRIINVNTRKLQTIRSHMGATYSASWSPDGKRLSLNVTLNKNHEIFIYDIARKRFHPLVTHPAIDAESAWSNDGRWIYFTSDRSGLPRLYRMPVSGGKIQLLTQHGSYSAQPSLSADGKYLTMTRSGKRHNTCFALMDIAAGTYQCLSRQEIVSTAPFSPDGTLIVHPEKRTKGSTLYTISVTGRVKWRLFASDGIMSDPAWEPDYY